LRKQIKMYKNKRIYCDNSKYIFEYFENKKNISTGVATQQVNILNSFFKLNRNTPRPPTSPTRLKKYVNSKFVYQKYWKTLATTIQPERLL
jgi:hypothetical protein